MKKFKVIAFRLVLACICYWVNELSILVSYVLDVVLPDAGLKKVPRKVGRVANRNTVKRLTVDFDEAGNPSGPNAGAFKRSINSYVCHFLPVRFKQIGDVPADDYKSVLNVLMVGISILSMYKYALQIFDFFCYHSYS